MNFQNQNNPQMYQNYANAWDQGTYQQIPHEQAYQNYQQFVQNAPPQAVEQMHQQYYQQMPPQQRGGILENLLGGLAQRGVSPQQIGIQNPNPYTMSPQEAARVTTYAQQQQPDLIDQVLGPGGALGSPMAKIAVAGIAALAAKQFLGGGFGNNNNRGGGLF
jgi:hypothetical protein